MLSQSKDFLCNMTDIPAKGSKDYDAFWANETKKVEYGLTVDGVYIHGWLYWHTQLWDIYMFEKDPINHTVKRVQQRANFRDNEWMIAEGLQEAEQDKKGIMIFGSRRQGKSEFIASHIGRNATLFKGSENAVTGGNWDDIDIITGKVMLGLDNLPEYYRFGRISENPRKAIELGFKLRGGKRVPWSKIIMRNFDNGNDTEAAAGITAKSFVIDEIGKFPFAKCFAAAKPAFTSPYGWACVPILTGTSGDIKRSSDAEKFFLAPDAHNFITRYLKEEGNKKVSIFISGLRRMEGKYDTTLGDYVKTESGILIPKDSELYTIKFQNSDFKKAEAVIDADREAALKSPDSSALLKEIMYYPKNTKELFLHDSGNNFPIEAINEQIEYLLSNPELQGIPVRLYRGADTKVKISFNTDRKAILNYPLETGDTKESTPIMYEEPTPNLPAYLYISGADPYNQSGSEWSNSLGSCYIYKRMYDPISGTFQRRIVMSYTARPAGGLKEFHETVEMMLELYGAVCMPENEAGTFIQHFDHRNKMHLLADGYDFLKEIAPRTSVPSTRVKGLPAVVRIQRYYKELVFQYLTEEIPMGFDPNTGEILKKLGVCRINDIGLLRELAAYNDEGNFDRYVAFGHTLAYEAWADKIYPYISPIKTVEEKPKEFPKPKVTSPFGSLGKSDPFGTFMHKINTGKVNPFQTQK